MWWGTLKGLCQSKYSGIAMEKKKIEPKLQYDVCGRCGVLFDDQGENGWWIEDGLWWHECNDDQPARIVIRKLARVA